MRSLVVLACFGSVAYAEQPAGTFDEYKTPRERPEGAPADAWIAGSLQPLTNGWRAVAGPMPKLAGDWTAVKVVQRERVGAFVQRERVTALALQYDGGWYEHHLGEVVHDDQTDHTITVRSIRVKDVVPGGAPELLVEVFEHDHGAIGGPGESVVDTEYLHVCGIGASNLPSCVVTEIADDIKSPVHERAYRLAWRFDKAGRFVTRARGAWPRRLSRRDYEGTRPLFFR